MYSNLPPGVTTSMLPGNSKAEMEAEAEADHLYTILDSCGYDVNDDRVDVLVEKLMEYGRAKLDAGFNEGQCELAMFNTIVPMEEGLTLDRARALPDFMKWFLLFYRYHTRGEQAFDYKTMIKEKVIEGFRFLGYGHPDDETILTPQYDPEAW